jgi:hypothetical protein
MAQLTKKRLAIVIVFLAAVILVIWGLLPLLIRPTLAQEKWYPPGLVEAKMRWDARPFSRYRMVLEIPNLMDGTLFCEVDVDVQDEKVIRTFRNSCRTDDLLTVSGLFRLIEHDANHPERPNGLNCDAMIVHPIYNVQIGYPEKIDYKQEYPTSLTAPPAIYEQHKAYWEAGNQCTLMGMLRPGYVIRSLMPLPESVIF